MTHERKVRVFEMKIGRTRLFEIEMIGKEEDLFFGGLLLHAAKAIIYQISKN